MRRTWLAITFWIVAAAFAGRALYILGDELRRARQPAPDQAVLETQYYTALRSHLPATGTVGYLTMADKDVNRRVRHYILMQYTLAPLIVHDSPDEPLVIANFPDAAQLANAIHGRHLRVRDWLGPAAPGLAVLENLDKTPPAGIGATGATGGGDVPGSGEAPPR